MIIPSDKKLFHVTDVELQRAYKFYCQCPDGQWDEEASLCIEAVLYERGWKFETVSGRWIKQARTCHATSVTAGETAHPALNAQEHRQSEGRAEFGSVTGWDLIDFVDRGCCRQDACVPGA